MKNSISITLLKNYIFMFIISSLLVFICYCILVISNQIISKKLVSKIYTADVLMLDDYNAINVEDIIKNKGNVLVVTKDLNVVNLGGPPAIRNKKLTTKQWSNFLINSNRKDNLYNYSIHYNESKNFWLVVTFPVSIRINLSIITNKDMLSSDLKNAVLILLFVFIIYFALLFVSTFIYAKISSDSFIKPLKALCNSTKNLVQGQYKEILNLNLIGEFAELQENFNELAVQLETQRNHREKSEKLRKHIILDISHDLKNPLASIMGYSELYINGNLNNEEKDNYIRIIHHNSVRANHLITELFQLSKLDSPDFKLTLTKIDICEFIREKISNMLPLLEEAKFQWEFNIPETEIITKIDTNEMDKLFFNLFTNAIKYNHPDTLLTIGVKSNINNIIIIIADNGVGINKDLEKEIFYPFIRTDKSRNSQTGGSGLGLTIVKKIVEAHGGTISLETSEGTGCKFTITLPYLR